MWCSPPDAFITPEQYARIAQAGFTVVSPPCGGTGSVARNKKILDLAAGAGLSAIIADDRMPLKITGEPNAAARIKAIVSDYKKHPALLGYFITDEPGAAAFGGLAEVVAELRRLDPARLAYINLFPNYASTELTAHPSQLGTDTYDAYLAAYMSTVKPQMLSWDHYHLMLNGDRAGFFANLASGAKAASSAMPSVPFWQILLSVKHGGYRALNENELRYQAMQTLAYGAQGLSWFTYWLPDDSSFHWSDSIMNADGTPGPLYEPVKHVNAEVHAIAEWIYGAITVGTFQTGTVPPDGTPASDDLPVHVVGPGNLTVAMFRQAGGYAYVLATNRDYKSVVSTELAISVSDKKLEMLDIASGKWSQAKGDKDNDDRTHIKFDLPAAGAALIRWR
jgi:hypothetical protein